MGILLQAFMVLLLISTGIGALLTNFQSQKQSHLRQLETFDNQSFGLALEKIFSNSDTCQWVFTGVDLHAPAISTVLSGQEIKSQDSMGAEISLYQTGFVYSSVQINNIQFEIQTCGTPPVDPAQCAPGPPVFNRQIMVRWEGQSQMGGQRQMRGVVGPVLIESIAGGGVSACRYFKGSGGGGGGGGGANPLTCENFGLVTSGTSCVGQTSLFAAMMADPGAPVNGLPIVNTVTPADDFIVKTAWRFGRDLSTRNALQGGLIRNLQTTGTGIYTFQTGSGLPCASPIGVNGACIMQFTITSPVYNNDCPNLGESQWAIYINDPLYRRICSATNPEPSLPICTSQTFTGGTCPIGIAP